METDAFQIYLDRLSLGKEQKLDAYLEPSDLIEGDENLLFKAPVHLNGRAYLAEDELIMQLDIEATAWMPCAVCNEFTPFKLNLEQHYLTQDLNEIQGAIFDFRELVLEEILVNLPHLVECQGNCPKRKELGNYLKKESSEEGTYNPFEGLS